jgi:hypothetical protein
MTPLMLVGFVASAVAAPCTAPSTTTEVAAAFDEAEAKFTDLDVDGFIAATDRAFAALPCVSDKVTRSVAAEVHRFKGLRGMIDRDPTMARQAFAASRSLEPGYTFPASLVAEDNPIRTEFSALDPAAGTLDAVPEPAEGALSFDGRDTGNRRPVTYPTIAQYTDAAGAVIQTAYLMPGAQMIEYPVRTLPVTNVIPDEPVAPVKGKGINIPLLGGAGALAIASGAMWTVAGMSHARYWDTEDPITDVDELASVRGTTNAMMIGALGAAGGAVGLGVGSVVVSARW